MKSVELIKSFTADFELEYENFILNHENSMMYHSIKYLNFLKGLIRAKTLCVVCRKEGKIDGVLPIMYKDGKFGRVMNSLPYYGSNGSVLTSCEQSTNLILNFYDQISSDSKVASSTIITNPFEIKSIFNKTDFTHKDYRIGQLTDIEFSDNHREKLLKKFHYKTRNVIRKALKHNVNVVIDNSKLNLLYQLHKDNMESIGGIAKEIEIIDHIKHVYKENEDYKVYIAKYENKIVAGLLVFYFKDTVEYYMPVINNEYRNLQALSLLIFEAMTEASVFGFKNWNWGGTWESQKGVYSFKKKWGTIDQNYYYLTKLNNEEIFTLDEGTLLNEYSNFYVIPFKYLLKNE
jgi:hypothetical protein